MSRRCSATASVEEGGEALQAADLVEEAASQASASNARGPMVPHGARWIPLSSKTFGYIGTCGHHSNPMYEVYSAQ